MGMNRTIGISI